MPTQTERVFTQKMMPDRVEVRVDEQTGQKEVVFLYVRNISRNLDVFKTDCAHALQDIGLNVRVSALNNEISLEQFERQGVYQFKQSQTVLSKQGVYNKRSELKRLETELQNMFQGDSRYYLLAQRVQHLRAMLATVDPLASPESLRKSAEQLVKLQELFTNNPQEGTSPEESKQLTPLTIYNNLTDEQVKRLEYADLVRIRLEMKIPDYSQEWSDILTRYYKCKGDNTNAERKSNVAGEDNTANKDGEGGVTIPSGAD